MRETRPIKKNKNEVLSMKKIAIMTYAPLAQVKTILEKKQGAYTAFALIQHDKDKAPKHCHIFIKFNCERRGTDILKWFELCCDENGEIVNTRFEQVHSEKGLLDYLTHSNTPEKHQYDEKEIIYSDENAREELLKECIIDNGYGALEDMLLGVRLKDIARKWGRDFIRHYTAYKMLANDIRLEENDERARMWAKIAEQEIENFKQTANGQAEIKL